MFQKIFKTGLETRNPSLLSYFHFLKETEKWPLEKLQNYQLQKCKEFLQFIYNYSPFYKKHFDEIGFIPSSLENLEDLSKIPPISKQTLIEKNREIHAVYQFKKTFPSETSGTSGQPLKFYRNEEWDSHNRAAMFRGYSWYEVKPWKRNGYFWGYNIDKKVILKTKFLDLIQNRFRIFSYEQKEILNFVKKLEKAEYLHGYSSMIYEVAKIINEENLSKNFNLKMIKGTSEKIFDKYQEEVKKAFGRSIVSEYGAAESGLIAYECPSGNMHINMENVIVQIENDEIIVTNLLSKSFPIVRYKLGDSIKLASPSFKCKCGRNHPVIVEIEGRVGKRIMGKKHSYPSLTLYYVFKNLAIHKNIILNYQAIQEESGKVELRIEQEEKNNYKELVREQLHNYFSSDIEFNICFGCEFRKGNGKFKDFITTLN